MGQRTQVIEIYAPTRGRQHDAPTALIDRRSQPDGNNGKMYFGVNQKEDGTSLYAAGAGNSVTAPANFIYEAKFPTANVLEVFTHTGIHKYSSGTDSYVVDGQTYTGTIADYWSAVMHNNQFFFTNGIDPLQVKTSATATATNLASAINTNTYKALSMASFRDHLNLYNVSENGTQYYKRVRWTKKGILTLAAGATDWNSGVAGAIDLQEAEGALRLAVPLGPTLAVYAEKSILIQTWIGGDEVYRFTKTVSGVGTPSRRGVFSDGQVNYFVGNNNFWAYYGGDDLRAIGDSVKQFAFGEINNSSLANAYVEYDPDFDEVKFHVPVNTDTQPTVVWVYRRENESWSRLERTYTSHGRFTRVTGLTIGELVGSIGAQTFKYSEANVRGGSEVNLYSDTNGYIVKGDVTRYSLSYNSTNTAQAYSYYTPELAAFPPASSGVDKLDKGYPFVSIGEGTNVSQSAADHNLVSAVFIFCRWQFE